MIPSGLISMSSRGISCRRTAPASALNGAAERPWKDRAQSTCFSSSDSTGGGSERPSVRERRGASGSVSGSSTASADLAGAGLPGRGIAVAVDCETGLALEAGGCRLKLEVVRWRRDR